jgi:pRiA4b ORF-3-like protein
MPTPASVAVYQLRIRLDRISPLIWRRLLVSDATTIAELHANSASIGTVAATIAKKEAVCCMMAFGLGSIWTPNSEAGTPTNHGIKADDGRGSGRILGSPEPLP